MIALPEPVHSLLGGIEEKAITNFYGAAGTGKTNICLLAALDCVRQGKRVMFIDTEGGFSVERLKQLTPNYTRVLEQIRLCEPKSFEEQGQLIRRLEPDSGLVVVDSVVALYRLEYAEGNMKDLLVEANRELSKQLSLLNIFSREHNIPVVVTAHTFRNWDTGRDEVVGGEVIKYWSKGLVFLERTHRMSERRAVIMKHRSLSEGSAVKFMIVQEGIRPSGFRLFKGG